MAEQCFDLPGCTFGRAGSGFHMPDPSEICPARAHWYRTTSGGTREVALYGISEALTDVSDSSPSRGKTDNSDLHSTFCPIIGQRR